MRRRITSAALVAVLAGGCSSLLPDDPENLPERGYWHSEVKLVAVVVNDLWVEDDQLPFPMPERGLKSQGCVEPSFRSREEALRRIFRDRDMPCELTRFEHAPGRFSASGICGPVVRGSNQLSGTLELKGSESAREVDARLTLQLMIRRPSGQVDRARMAADIDWRRSRDC